MKRILLTSFAVLLVVCGTALANDVDHKTKVHIIFLGWYDKEQVELYLADKKIFSSKITTDPTSGTSGFVDVKVNKPAGVLTVKIPRLQLTATLDSIKGKYLYISFLKSDVSFEQTMTPLALD